MKNLIKTILLFLVILIQISPYHIDFNANTKIYQVTSETHDPILFIHGWARSSGDFLNLKIWFEADGWPNTYLYANNFDDRNNCTVQANINNANRISQWVDEILHNTGAEKVDLVGHSMGGLSSRYYIKFLDGLDKVDDYVSLGSPHHGEDVATCGAQGVNALAVILNEGDETPGGILNDTIGNRTDPVSGLVYNSTHIPGNISYTSIYSLDDAIPFISPPLDGANNTEVEGLAHIQLLSSKMVYEIIRAAVNDYFPDPTTTTTTQTITQTSTTAETTTQTSTPTQITTTQTAGWGMFPFLVIIAFTIWSKKKK
ncbi:MAG: esterase/lipase family protein [Candidatus Hodarchaeales archaeon]|jgi:triacylglycerol lipase